METRGTSPLSLAASEAPRCCSHRDFERKNPPFEQPPEHPLYWGNTETKAPTACGAHGLVSRWQFAQHLYPAASPQQHGPAAAPGRAGANNTVPKAACGQHHPAPRRQGVLSPNPCDERQRSDWKDTKREQVPLCWARFSSFTSSSPHTCPQLQRRSSAQVLKARNAACALSATGGSRDLSRSILGPTQHSPSFSPWKPLGHPATDSEEVSRHRTARQHPQTTCTPTSSRDQTHQPGNDGRSLTAPGAAGAQPQPWVFLSLQLTGTLQRPRSGPCQPRCQNAHFSFGTSPPRARTRLTWGFPRRLLPSQQRLEPVLQP